jgi:hypothetical protein
MLDIYRLSTYGSICLNILHPWFITSALFCKRGFISNGLVLHVINSGIVHGPIGLMHIYITHFKWPRPYTCCTYIPHGPAYALPHPAHCPVHLLLTACPYTLAHGLSCLLHCCTWHTRVSSLIIKHLLMVWSVFYIVECLCDSLSRSGSHLIVYFGFNILILLVVELSYYWSLLCTYSSRCLKVIAHTLSICGEACWS